MELDQAYTPDQCRTEARECRRRANAAATPRERARWVNIANLWDKAAAELRFEGWADQRG